eukprot:scaffold95530_cov20-Prasinocladus_malaysianus.AAC.2
MAQYMHIISAIISLNLYKRAKRSSNVSTSNEIPRTALILKSPQDFVGPLNGMNGVTAMVAPTM